MHIKKTISRAAWVAAFAFLACTVQRVTAERATVKTTHVNVRAKASIYSEVVLQLRKGETVDAIEVTNIAHPKPGEPAKWWRIRIPTNTPVWVFASFVDPAKKTVTAHRLNVRAGPGENFSVVGRITRGTHLNVIRKLDKWLEIQAPPHTYAYVASGLLDVHHKQGQASTEAAPKAHPAPKKLVKASPGKAKGNKSRAHKPAAKVAEAPAATLPSGVPLAKLAASKPPTAAQPAGKKVKSSAKTKKPAAAASAPPIAAAPVLASNQASASPSPEAQTEDLKALAPSSPPVGPPGAAGSNSKPKYSKRPRIISREGTVHRSISIQAPTDFRLVSFRTRETIDYLDAKKLKLKLDKFDGRKVFATGREYLDPRWPGTPVLVLDSLRLEP